MRRQHFSEIAMFKPRLVMALALCSVGLSFAVISVRGVSTSISTTAPGFHAAVIAAGSNGGSESYVGIPFVGSHTGNRVLAWQAGARYNISPDGVNWNFANGQIPGNSGGGDVST